MRFGPILLCTGLLAAQTQPAAQDKCRVEGKVLNSVTSQPVTRARVTLQALRASASQVPLSPGGAAAPASTLTDGEGKFVFAGVSPGAYRIGAQRDNFQPDPSRRSESLNLAAGDEKADVVIQLTPLGAIAGHVRNEEGDPLQYLQVAVMVYQYGPGGRQLTARNNASTNDLGEYRIFGLAAGKYYLRASSLGRAPSLGEDETYLAIYYPGAADPSGAAPLELGAGQDLGGIDFTLRRTRAVSIRGRVVKPVAASNVMVTSMPAAGGPGMTAVGSNPNDPEGKFELRGAAPGSYILRAQARVGDKTYLGVRAVQVGADDIEGIELRLAPPVDLGGSVRVEGSTSAKPSAVSIGLQGTLITPGSSAVNNDWTFTLRNVTPDTYRPNVMVRAADLYVKSVRCGDTDVAESGLDLTRGGGCDLVVTLSANGAQIEGTVEDDSSRPAAAAMVTLVAEGTRRNDLFKVAVTDAGGHFKITGVAPGGYHLYAWEEVDTNAVRYDPDFVKPFESYGKSLRIAEGARESVSLKQIGKPAGQ